MVKIIPIALAVFLHAGTTHAVTTYSGYLTGAQETVPNASTATGFGTAILSDDMNTLTVNVTWSGLSAPAAAAHIHCCAPLGVNGPVAVDLSPLALVSGSAVQIFDLTLGSSYGSGFLTASGGTADFARMRLINGLNAEEAYFNVHNANFPGGEIRGQIAPIPEPETWALLLAGLTLVSASVRKRARNAGASDGRRTAPIASNLVERT